MSYEDDSIQERRRAGRASVIRAAKIIYGVSQSVCDCLVLEQSQAGLQVDLGVAQTLPELVTIQFGGGASFYARRIWCSGTKAGFQIEGAELLSDDTVEQMKQYRDALGRQGLLRAVAAMREARFLEHGGLRQLAEEAEAAYLRLDMFLETPIL